MPPLVPELLDRTLLEALLPGLLAIDRDTPGEPWAEAHWRADLPAKWELSRVVRDGDAPLAFLVASRQPGRVHVHRVAVARNARRLGLATVLLGAVARHAVAIGAPIVSLKVAPDNVGALALYARLGFAPAGDDGRALHAASAALVERAADAPAPVPSPFPTVR